MHPVVFTWAKQPIVAVEVVSNRQMQDGHTIVLIVATLPALLLVAR
jgi:hypothetical protein